MSGAGAHVKYCLCVSGVLEQAEVSAKIPDPSEEDLDRWGEQALSSLQGTGCLFTSLRCPL